MNILITDLVDDFFIDLLKKNNINYTQDTFSNSEDILNKIHLF